MLSTNPSVSFADSSVIACNYGALAPPLLHRGAYRCGGIAQRQKPLRSHPLSGWFSETNEIPQRKIPLGDDFLFCLEITHRIDTSLHRQKFLLRRLL